MARVVGSFQICKGTSTAALFHYLRDYDTARKISRDGFFIPSEDETLYNFEHNNKPHINLTEVRPEERKQEIQIATSIPEGDIKFGLEFLVSTKNLVDSPYLVRSYRIYSEENVPVRVLRIWNVDKVEQKIRSGYKIRRFIGPNGIPYAFYSR